MMQSYPGQYPGVTKIKVMEQGTPADADRYQELIDTIYQEPDPAEPPSLDVNYRTDQAVVTAMTTRGGFHWEYKDKDCPVSYTHLDQIFRSLRNHKGFPRARSGQD